MCGMKLVVMKRSVFLGVWILSWGCVLIMVGWIYKKELVFFLGSYFGLLMDMRILMSFLSFLGLKFGREIWRVDMSMCLVL